MARDQSLAHLLAQDSMWVEPYIFPIILFLLRREIVIHVCDETRGTKKDFTCPQGLLLEKMVYFRDITLGQQLDDVDISVHCDVKIFDWLM